MKDYNKKLKTITGSQNKRLLRWLIDRKSITVKQAWNELGIYRLSARIHDLRGEDIEIRTILIETVDGNGDIKCVAKYILE